MRAVDLAADGKGKIYDAALLRRLWPFLRPHAGPMAAALCLLPLITAVDLGRPYLIKVTVDEHLLPGQSEGLATLGLLYLSLVLMQSLFNFVHFYVIQRAAQRALSDLRREVFRRYQAMDMAYLDRNPVGRLMTRATTDIEALSHMFGSGLLSMLSDLVTMVGMLAVMFWLDAELTLSMLLVFPFAYLLTDWIQKRMRRFFRVAREKLAAMNAFIQENVGGIRVVHLFDLQQDHQQRFEELNREYRDAYHRSNLYDSSLFSTMEFTGNACVGLFLLVGAGRVDQGLLTVGVLVAFIEYVGRFFAPLRDLSSKIAVMQSAMSAAEKIVAVLDTEPTIRDPAEPRSLPPGGRGEVRFEGVRFHYREDTPVLQGLDLVIHPGEKVAVVGATGAGKTTLIKLLERFYDPIEGRVLLDGEDIRRLRPRKLRQELAVVLQEVFLVAGTVEENVRLGAEEVTAEAIRAACKAVEAEPFIHELPGGYRARIQERGANLSAGERQLISFARALVRNPRVLILDEATSNVDVETEARLKRALARLMVDRTAIVIAHRLSTIRACDRVLVMNQGELVETGTHEELLDQGGIYSKLYALQEKDLLSVPTEARLRVGAR